MTSTASPPGAVDPAFVERGDIDDMQDTLGDRDVASEAPPLYSALAVLDEHLLSRHKEHDAIALKSQERYRFALFAMAWGSGLAAVLALAQIAFFALEMNYYDRLAEKAEALLVIMAGIGLVSALQLAELENWLLERFKAEQLRLLKFRFLIDPRLWGPPAARKQWEDDLLRERNATISVKRENLAAEAERDTLWRVPRPQDCADFATPHLRTLLEYYRRTRIEAQRAHYTAMVIRGTSRLDEPRLLSWVFLASTVMIAGHVLIGQILQRRSTWLDDASGFWTFISIVLVSGAVALPVTWAGIRLWRGGRKSSRDVVRAKARLHMLNNFSGMLYGLAETEPCHALSQLQMLEMIFAIDQREWLRLTRESERHT